MKRLLIAIFSLYLMGSCDNSGRSKVNVVISRGGPPSDYTGNTTKILEDNIHSSRQNSTIKASFSNMDYNHSHGYYNTFNILHHFGFIHDSIDSGYLTYELLKQYDILFVNLTDDSHPKFTTDEIDSVKQFVEEGGGLFVIVDHTNAYGSSARTEPLIAPYGFSLPYELACDRGEGSIKDFHWLNITRFNAHPVTEDLQNIGLFAAGPISGNGSLAFTSENGFSDFWNPDNPSSYWGNFVQDEDEPTKSNSILNGVTFDEGRVVVAGDQNMFGNTFLGFADNRKLLLNIAKWLGKRESESEIFQTTKLPLKHLVVDGRTDNFSISNQSSTGFSALWGYLSKQSNYHITYILHEPAQTPDFLVLSEPSTIIDATDLASVDSVLSSGGTVLLTIDLKNPKSGQISLIDRFIPELSFVDDNGIGIDPLHNADDRNYINPNIENCEVICDFETTHDISFDYLYNIHVANSEYVASSGENSLAETTDILIKKDNLFILLQPHILNNSGISNGKQPPGEYQLNSIYFLQELMKITGMDPVL